MATTKVTVQDQQQGNKNVNMGKWLSEGWRLIFEDIGLYLLVALVYILIIAILSGTAIGQFIVLGPLTVGFFYILYRKLHGKETQLGDLGKGFNFFAAAVISNILISIFVAIGFALCIIPGFVVLALYMFTPLYIFDKKLDFWQAMEASRKLVAKHVFEMSIFVLLLSIISIAGALACVVGLLITTPLCYAAIAYAYKDLVGFEEEKE